jgi:hypothetical protein
MPAPGGGAGWREVNYRTARVEWVPAWYHCRHMNRTAVVGVAAVCFVAGVLCGGIFFFLRGTFSHDRASVIAAWSPVVAMVTSNFVGADGSGQQHVASGILLKHPDGALVVLTNKQVLSYGGAGPVGCGVDFPNRLSATVLPADIASDAQGIEVGTLRPTTVVRVQTTAAEVEVEDIPETTQMKA